METTPTTQLKADLSMILAAIKGDPELSPPLKRHLGEIVAWGEAHVEHSKDLDDRLESAEAALSEIIEGDGEMLSPETAQTLTSANEHGQLLCEATAALLEGPLGGAIDSISKKRFQQLIANARAAFALSTQLINEIVAEDDDDDDQENEDDDGLGDDGDGVGAGDADEGAGEAEEDANG